MYVAGLHETEHLQCINSQFVGQDPGMTGMKIGVSSIKSEEESLQSGYSSRVFLKEGSRPWPGDLERRTLRIS